MDDKICRIHNEPALFCEREPQQNQVFLCRFCVQERFKFQNTDDAVNEEQQALKQLEIQFDQSIKQLQDFAQVDDIKKIGVIVKKLDYQLMQQSSYKQSEFCKAIAFNKDATFMIAGCEKLIKVFEFRNDKLSFIQSIDEHSDKVQCLYFMKKSNQFISGSLDSTMMIWKLDQNNLWQCIQVLQSHKSSPWCIIMNQNEDLLISGSCDKTIKFWKNQNNTWSCNQSINCQSTVYSISLNIQEDKLIASAYNNQILLIQLQGKDWMIKQKISVEQYGNRLCYINQNQFIIQPRTGQNLQIFDYDAKDQTYKKGQELHYKCEETYDECLFPIQHLSQIGLILVKNGNYVHLIKRDQYGQFKVGQSIHFNDPCIYGCITDDGRYIATWDNKSQEIQLRKFEF